MSHFLFLILATNSNPSSPNSSPVKNLSYHLIPSNHQTSRWSNVAPRISPTFYFTRTPCHRHPITNIRLSVVVMERADKLESEPSEFTRISRTGRRQEQPCQDDYPRTRQPTRPRWPTKDKRPKTKTLRIDWLSLKPLILKHESKAIHTSISVFTHSLILNSPHIHSPIHLVIHSFSHSPLIQSFIHFSFIHSFYPSFIHTNVLLLLMFKLFPFLYLCWLLLSVVVGLFSCYDFHCCCFYCCCLLCLFYVWLSVLQCCEVMPYLSFPHWFSVRTCTRHHLSVFVPLPTFV